MMHDATIFAECSILVESIRYIDAAELDRFSVSWSPSDWCGLFRDFKWSFFSFVEFGMKFDPCFSSSS